MKKIGFLLIIIVGGHILSVRAVSTKPNILWIVANDLSTDLGCYGNTQVHTPHLDQLAKEGIIYENFFTVGDVCSPSRSALITGMYSVSINSHNQFTKFKKPLPTPVVPFTNYLKKAGYYVTNSKGIQLENTGFYTGYNFSYDAEELFDGTDWRNRAPEQPFFAQVHLTYAHRPFKADPEHPVDPNKVALPPYYPDHPLARKDWALYLETVQLLDKQVGEILERLKKDGLAENTVVFFFADHGRPHVRGKQFLYDGGIHSPLIIKWPGQLTAGEKSDRMISNIDLAATVMNLAKLDIPDYMQGQDFLDEKTEKRKYIFAMRDRCDGTLDRIRAVRSKDFKYIRNFHPERPYTQFNGYKKWEYPVLTLMQVMYKNGELTPEQAHFMGTYRPEEELYDLRVDPFEMKNLADQQEYQKTLLDFRGELDRWLLAVDIGEYPEDSVEILEAKKIMQEEFITNMKKKGLAPTVSDEEFLEYWKNEFLKNP
ncbi:Choline-sulfatase [Cyclobacterium qasimii M12-11B]|nr:Choline-sulfatase [Cyclobacterium qasimii M12-11B]